MSRQITTLLVVIFLLLMVGQAGAQDFTRMTLLPYANLTAAELESLANPATDGSLTVETGSELDHLLWGLPSLDDINLESGPGSASLRLAYISRSALNPQEQRANLGTAIPFIYIERDASLYGGLLPLRAGSVVFVTGMAEGFPAAIGYLEPVETGPGIARPVLMPMNIELSSYLISLLPGVEIAEKESWIGMTALESERSFTPTFLVGLNQGGPIGIPVNLPTDDRELPPAVEPKWTGPITDIVRIDPD